MTSGLFIERIMMQKFDWKKLQNGSDIRGVALEGIPDEPVNLTPEVAKA